MAECKKSIINGPIISEWTGTFGEFKGLLKPGMPPFGGLDQPEALTKWLVAQFWVGVIAHTVNFVLNVLNGFMPIGGFIFGILGAFLGAWVSWFMLVKREPSCCCFCILVIENWKQMHLVYGAFMMFYGVYGILMAVLALTTSLAAGGIAVIYSAISLAVMTLYGITWFFIGLSAVKIGAKKAGVELPETVGKAGA